MLKFITNVHNKQDTENAIKAIGEELIRQAQDISREIDNVTSITIDAKITPDEIVNVNVTKNYVARLDKEGEDNK